MTWSPSRASSRARRTSRRLACALVLPVVLCLGLGGPAAVAVAPADEVFPTQAQVDAAKANAAQAAAMVTQINAQYAAASARLLTLQGEVSAAMAQVAQAEAVLQARTKELASAESAANEATARQQDATTSVRRDAAAMYKQQNGGLEQLSVFLSGQAPQDIADYTTAMGQVAQQRRTNLELATDSANIAAEATRRAEVARTQQQAARDAAEAARADAQTRVDAAQAETNQIQAEQTRRVATMAELQNVAVQVEQDRQDGLAAEAARIAAEQERQRQAAAAAASAGSSGSTGGGSSWPNPPSTPTGGGGDPRAIAQSLLGNYGWGMDQWSCLDQLWIGESGWNWAATNASSGAYGIPQALPASKMASSGSDWLTNPTTQIIWGMTYIKDRYGSPCGAWSFWLSKSPHWY